MKAEIRNKPAFANIVVELQQGDSLIAESDAMASMERSVDMQAKLAGGFFTAVLRRVFGNESMFVNVFSSKTRGTLILTQPVPGDIECIELSGNTLYLQPGAFIACESTVKLSVKWAGLASFVGREGLFRLKVSGTGKLWFGAFGGIFSREVSEELIVDTGHLVAYEPTVGLRIGMPAGVFSSLFGGEGLVTRVRGQGRVYLQSRSMSGLTAWTNTHLY